MNLQPSNLLCDLCKNISIETLNIPEGLKHADDSMFSTTPSTPIDEKCHLCVSFSHEVDLHHKKHFRLHLDSGQSDRYQTLAISYEGCDKSGIIRYPVFSDEGDPAALAGVRIRRRPEPPSSPEAYEVAKAWINNCTSNHLCSSTRTTSMQLEEHPARLIDLEPSSPLNEGSKDARIVPYRLTNSKYAALSYCWGTTMPSSSTTRQDNIRKRLKSLEASSLPQTLQDAFAVTRQLGIRYLWVDALCIIQDDPNDWAIEAVKMASIYRNCLISIAVELGSDCAAGFLSYNAEQQDFCIDRLIKISNRLKSGKLSNLYIWTPGICGCFYTSAVKSLQKTPLTERGWTYQERFLAPRILHFIGAQIVWECREIHGVSLEHGLGLEDTILHRSPSTYGSVAKLLMQFENTLNPKKLYENWYYNIVPEYSRRRLSQKSDKLPAISGIAKLFRLRFENDYFAGLWLDDISYSLSWNTELVANYPEFYRAPTFCWASIDGDVFYPRGTRENLTHYVHLTDWHIDFQGPDSYGCVTGGWIKIVGYLGNGIVQDGKLLNANTDFILGNARFDANRSLGAHNGKTVKYLFLSTTKPDQFNVCRVLLLKQNTEKEFEFERIGLSVSGDMDVHVNDAWLAKHCTWTGLTLL